MLNLDGTLVLTKQYITQRDFYTKGIFYSIGVIIFIEIFRNQVAEIDLLQLVPGFYLLLLFVSFLLLVISSDFLFRFSFEKDNKKEIGTRTVSKIYRILSSKFSIFLFWFAFCLVIYMIIPLSLESFNSYGEKTVENIWSFDEVINVEINLFLLLLVLFQFPVFFIEYIISEIQMNILPEFWKILSVGISIFSGIATPTIDGYTQLTISFSTLFLYILIISISEKRLDMKKRGLFSLAS